MSKQNPVLRLSARHLPDARSHYRRQSMRSAWGVAATLVLVCSNAAISALRNVIPDKVRIPAYITVIAGFVSVVQMLVKALCAGSGHLARHLSAVDRR